MTFALLDETRDAAERSPPTAVAERPARASISVVVPVRDNAEGVARLLRWWSPGVARELVFVDDGSTRPVVADGPAVRVLRTLPRGPAAARNVGWRAATGGWVAFLDSDCLPDARWPGAFGDGWSGEVAIQGRVRALGNDWLSRYYESQGVLRPMEWSADGRPTYLITANAMVHREALEAVGGFCESFPIAAGEDVDLGFRLGGIGSLRWCGTASVAHAFEPSLRAFVRRFVRYGRGNRLLARAHGPRFFAPRPFPPLAPSAANHILASLAFVCLLAGWTLER